LKEGGGIIDKIRNEHVRVGKLDIHYLTGGQGVPLIIIHGGGGGASGWQKNVRELSKNYRVYVPDLPGFGHSQPMGDDVSMSKFVQFVEDFSQAIGLKRFYLAGHSIGGGIALQYALRFPDKVEKLVLVDSMCLGEEIAPWIRFLSLPAFCRSIGRAALAITKFVGWLFGLFFAHIEFINPLPQVKIDVGEIVTTFKGQTTVLLNRLSDLLMPTLLVWGARDNIVPVSQAYAASQVIPDCQLHVFSNCGHSAYRENIEEFSQLLTRFFG